MATQVDLVALSPRPTRLPVASRVHDDEATFRQALLGGLPACGDRSDAAQERADDRNAEEQVVAHGVRRLVEATSPDHLEPDHPGVGHVEEAGMVPDHERRTAGGQLSCPRTSGEK